LIPSISDKAFVSNLKKWRDSGESIENKCFDACLRVMSFYNSVMRGTFTSWELFNVIIGFDS